MVETHLIVEKFGALYKITDDTFKMGTHQVCAQHIAKRFKGSSVVLDSCVGAGFMTIVIAQYVQKVIAVDINSDHLELARQNAEIAGVQHKIDFIEGDIMTSSIWKRIGKIDAAFLDPDWRPVGNAVEDHTTKLAEMQPPADKLLKRVNSSTKNIALRLPKIIDQNELDNFLQNEIEQMNLDGSIKFYTVYFGNLMNAKGFTLAELKISTQTVLNRF